MYKFTLNNIYNIYWITYGVTLTPGTLLVINSEAAIAFDLPTSSGL